MGRDPLTNQAISAANAAQAAAAAVAAAAANAANVTTSSANLASASNLFQSSSANPLLNNPLASSTAFGMTGLPGTNTLLEDLIEGKHIIKHPCMPSCINPPKSIAKSFIPFSSALWVSRKHSYALILARMFTWSPRRKIIG